MLPNTIIEMFSSAQLQKLNAIPKQRVVRNKNVKM